ncbi:MAG: hypothetical protein A2W91_04945 [Bacteroidetes bacterium GWF2_38_335]|nr:MAG: hypothetical protein A2W91_04945 [Bacteroidetes bacterium GWF2_38_335]OFY79822.1 MAG: hypothetical protein A2281_10475 [Bacteroidetes bacterium RIFOXYA12_FULL_38_20]
MKQRITLFMIMAIVLTTTIKIKSQDVNTVWAKSMGGIEGHNYGNSLSIDLDGNVYTTGTYYETADFDPSASIYELNSNGMSDVFVSKLDSNGTFVWAKSFGGTAVDNSYSIDCDNYGNVFTTGCFYWTGDFDPDFDSVFNLTSSGNTDIFVSKLDSDGEFVWARRFGGKYEDKGISIIVDEFGNVYSTGWFKDTADFDPDPLNTYDLISSGGKDVYISKLNSVGDYVWVKQITSSGDVVVKDMVFDNSYNLLLTGYFYSQTDFDPDPGEEFILDPDGNKDVFIAKYDTLGCLVWAKYFDGESDNYSYSISTDIFNNVFTVGDISSLTDFDPSPSGYFLVDGYPGDNIFVSKLDSNGNFVWVKQVSGEILIFATSICNDNDGNSYIGGQFYGDADFDPSWSEYILSETYTYGGDMFLLKLDSAGNFIYAHQIGGNEDDLINDIKVDLAGNIYTTGIYMNDVNFNPFTGDDLTLSASGMYTDVFVHKMRQEVSSNIEYDVNTFTELFPNPSNGIFLINSKDLIEYKIYDFNGRVVNHSFIKGNQHKVNMQNCNNGIYIIKIKSINGYSLKKIIVNK